MSNVEFAKEYVARAAYKREGLEEFYDPEAIRLLGPEGAFRQAAQIRGFLYDAEQRQIAHEAKLARWEARAQRYPLTFFVLRFLRRNIGNIIMLLIAATWLYYFVQGLLSFLLLFF